ncbi:MAG: hypothetical protein GXY55_16975 [Phycisphaerae bacterium]|nr:hypothetical protein [Phycisphaerae bacterium]
MRTQKTMLRIAGWLLCTVTAVAVMGADCTWVPFPVMNTVDIELVNETEYPIEPRLFVDPRADLTVYEDLIQEANWVVVDPPLAPGEVATYTFYCADAGTIASDYAIMLLSDTEGYESDNGPWVWYEHDYLCGDTISFIFIDEYDIGGDFFTRVEVNGEFVTDQ